MRKLITWIVVTIGIAALVRKLRGRGKADVPEPPPPPAADPADELRQKLATSREPEPAADTAAAPPEPASDTEIDERRAEVHEEGRGAIDEMRKATED
jgi:hypothetical protein